MFQVVKSNVSNLEEALARLSDRMEAHDQQGAKRSQEVASLSQQQWAGCGQVLAMPQTPIPLCLSSL